MTAAEYQASWCQAELADICSKPQYGYTTKASSEGSVKFLRTTDITKGPIRWGDVPFCETAPEDVQKYQLEHRDIVISRAGSIGFSSLLMDPPAKSVFASYLIRFKPSKQFSERFLKRFLESHGYWSQLASMSAGNAVQNVNAQKLSKIIVPVAPLAEQKVIADKLDTLLAQVESIQARLERIPQLLKRFRQSVLAAAVNGRLTEEWRSQNSFTSPRGTWPSCKEIAKPFEIPNGWAGVALGSVSERVSVGHVGKTSEFYTDEESGIPFLRSQNVRPGRVSLDGLAYITEPFHQSLKKSQLQSGDLLIVRVGANRGDACVLPTMFSQVNCANIVFARPKPGLSPYLNLYFQSPISQELLLGATVGGAQGVINTKSVAQTFLALPPVEEQTEIVRRVDQLFVHADCIEQQVNNALARVNNLTQSILAKAFRGELTEQWRKDNPELISGENSAEALLERIRAERAATQPAKKTRKQITA